MRLVFMGTPEFAVPILTALYEGDNEVVAVVTQPDARRGRSKKLWPSPVKEKAQEWGLPVYTFPRIKHPDAAEQLEHFRADVMVTAAYGQILSQRNLDAAKWGVVNAHASLLPQYRGAAPANFAIINGEKETGVTTMYTDIGVDTGDMIFQERIPIGPEETAGELLLRLSHLAAQVMGKTLEAMERGEAPRIPQDEREASHYPMLKKEDGLLDFTKPAQDIHNLTRGVDPWPGAYTYLDGERLKLFSPQLIEGKGTPGEVLAFSPKEGMVVATGDGAIRFLRVQPVGKNVMADEDFIRGKRHVPGGLTREP